MNKNYDEYLVMGDCQPTEKNSIKIPPETAKDTSKYGLSINVAKENYMLIEALPHKCKGSKDGKVNNRILRDGRNIKNKKEQDER